MMSRLLVSLSVMTLLTGAGPADAPKARPWNILFLMSDDMRPDLGAYGHALARSPNIDALAAAGVRFDRAYCQYPLCNPSRTSLLTGRHPTTTGVLDNSGDFRKLHPDWVTLPEHFKANGYVSLRTGKIFHGGIDDAKSWTEGAEPRRQVTKADIKTRQANSDRFVVLEGDGESHADYRTADRAIEFLRDHKDHPFFLACGFTKPHSAPTAPRKHFDLYDASKVQLPVNFVARPTVPDGFPNPSITPNADLFIGRDASEAQAREMTRAYLASITFVDENLGRVVAELDRLGLRENTVVVFWGDHGYHLGEMGKWAKHGSLFEVGTRVPLIVVAPGAKGNGQAVSAPVQTLDLVPTLCELCGLAPPAGIEGRSLRPLLENPAAPWDHPAYSVAGNRKNLGVGVRTARYRYAEWDGGKNGAMLFDHKNDPNELKNLADDPAFAKVRDELAELAKAHAASSTR